MLKEVGCTWVILGHSERRILLHVLVKHYKNVNQEKQMKLLNDKFEKSTNADIAKKIRIIYGGMIISEFI